MFELASRDGAVYVAGDHDLLKAGRRKPRFRCSVSDTAQADDAGVVVVGGGSGAIATVEALRENGYGGRLTMVSSEGYLPIDRPKLSKAFIGDAAKLALRDAEWFASGNVKVVEDEVVGVDFGAREVATAKGQRIPYGKLVLATGGIPRNLPLPGFKVLGNIFTLRSVGDVQAILGAVGPEKKGKKLVIVGSSFIGMEAANALANGNDVSVVGMESRPLERVLGAQVGATLQKGLEGKGVKFYMSASVDRAEPSAADASKVGAVVLKDGTSLPADVVILGVGVAPATQFLKDNSAVQLERDGSLKVDESFRVVGLSDVYAVGDIATYPYHGPGSGSAGGAPGTVAYTRIEHWNVAQNSGRVAARQIVSGSPEGDDASKRPPWFVPVFWSALAAQVRYCGNGQMGWDDVVVQGDLDSGSWAAFYCKGEEVVAVASSGRDPVVSQASALMRSGMMPGKAELQSGKDILTILAE